MTISARQRDIFRYFAEQVSVHPAVIEAIAVVEAGGRSGFLNSGPRSGLPRILYEPARFHAETRGRFTVSHPHLSIPKWSPSFRYGLLSEQWDKLEAAMALDHDAAIKSTSFGRAQILGSNWQACGVDSVGAFYWAMHSVKGQLHCTLEFARSNPKLLAAARQADWHRVAHIYNGSRYAEHAWHERLEAAYRAALRHYPEVVNA